MVSLIRFETCQTREGVCRKTRVLTDESTGLNTLLVECYLKFLTVFRLCFSYEVVTQTQRGRESQPNRLLEESIQPACEAGGDK